MGTIQPPFGRRVLAGLLLIGAGWSQKAEAQVGLRSAPAQVTLIARTVPAGAVSGLGDLWWARRSGTAIEGTQSLRLSANSSYSVVVRGLSRPTSAARTWVRSVKGDFQEITSGSSVIVARGQGEAGEIEQLVEYRIHVSPGSEPTQLPVAYELYIAPTL